MKFNQMRLAFMGTPNFAVRILEVLLKNHYQIVAVYTQPPRPMGRGYKMTASPVQELAMTHKIPVFTPESLKTEKARTQWEALDLDVAVVAAYGLILPKAILKAPHRGCLNIHTSLLPRWRGAAPIQRALLAGDKETGVTLMKMDEGLDTGDILLTKITSISNTMTTSDLEEVLANLGAEAILEALPLYLEGKLNPTPQPQEGITYAEKLTKTEGLLDWRLPALVLERKIRALNPWPGTWFEVGKDRIKILKAEVITGHFAPPGSILDEKLTIACGEGALRPLIVQKVGKSPLSTDAFLRGYEFPSKQLPYVTL